MRDRGSPARAGSAGRLALLATTLLLAGCATHPPDGPGGHRGPPREGFGPPPGEGRGPPPGGGGRGRLFISPMGEPFRGGEPGALMPAAAWFAGADTDHDGRVTRAEFEADALRFFATLDTDHDGEIGPSEIDRYEDVVAPEIRVGGGGDMGGGRPAGRGRGGGGRHGGGGSDPGGGGMGGGGEGGMGGGGMGGGPPGGGGGGGPPGGGGGGGGDGPPDGGGGSRPGGQGLQGAARFGYLALPEPVIAADADFNRGVSRAEFARAAQQRFLLLDHDGNGALTEAELPRIGERRR